MSSNTGGGNNEAITVVVRCRPMNKKETDEKRSNIIDVDVENRSVGIRSLNSGEEPKYFTFDATYDEKTQQRHFYDESCFNIIESALEGFNATIFAYGQTGCGKSFTMQGPSTSDEEMRGVIPNSFYHIFQFVKSTKNVEFLIRCSYLELYNEEIHDLLTNQKNPPKCELKEDTTKGIYVKGLSDVVVESPDDLVKMFDRGLTNRTTASTNMNAESSRSHSVFSIVIEMSTKDETTGKDMLRVGKLNLVDLAGSERAKKTGAKDQVLKEGIKINLSLTALGNVISALSEGGRHIPYRDSKLTRLLQDSLGGSAKTMMVAAISPADYNHEETLSTLRYANRAKNIKNKPKINEDPKDTMIREFKAEIERLKNLLMQQNSGALFAQFVGAPAGINNNAQAGAVADPIASSSPQGQQKIVQNRSMKFENNSNVNVTNNETGLAVSSESLVGGRNNNNDNFAVTGKTTTNYDMDDFVEVTEPSNSTSPVKNDLGRTTSSLDDVYATSEFEPYIPENEAAVVDVAEIRDEIEQRIHQLAHMLVNNHDEDNLDTTISIAALENGDNNTSNDHNNRQASLKKLSPIKSEKFNDTVIAPTAEELAKEAESLRQYKEKKQRAKLKKEEKQRREMQRILDEKKAMEEELEELRFNHQSQQQPFAQVQQLPSLTGIDNENNSVVYDEKKFQKLKKKYEKKIATLNEELDEVRDDFAYQRKQLMDAVVEQEKDTRLYGAICRSLLSDRDLQRIIEKSRYDEDRDEWSVPLSKKKNIDHLLDNNFTPLYPINNNFSNNNNNGNVNNSGNGPLSSRSMLPDINIKPLNNNNNNNNLKPQPPVGQAPDFKRHNKPSKSKSNNNKAGNKKPKIPLLTLPGSLVSAADLENNYDHDDGDDDGNNNINNSNNYANEQDSNYYYNNNNIISHNTSNNSSYFPQYSGRSRDNSNEYNAYYSSNSSNNNNFSLPGIVSGTVKGSNNNNNNNYTNGNAISNNSINNSNKPKIPKPNSQFSGVASGNSCNTPKMPMIGGNNASNNGINNNYYYNNNNNNNAYSSMMDQAGSGENAGPIKDWGFTMNNSGNNKKKGDGFDEYFDSPEGETFYSDDEDFVVDNNSNAHNVTRKKKKNGKNGNKNKSHYVRNSRDNGDEYYLNNSGGGGGNNGAMLPPVSGATPRQSAGFSLPPI